MFLRSWLRLPERWPGEEGLSWLEGQVRAAPPLPGHAWLHFVKIFIFFLSARIIQTLNVENSSGWVTGFERRAWLQHRRMSIYHPGAQLTQSDDPQRRRGRTDLALTRVEGGGQPESDLWSCGAPLAYKPNINHQAF